MSDEFQQRSAELIAAGQTLYARGMLPATSGNLSARLGDGGFAITASGTHKGQLTAEQILHLDAAGQPLTAAARPSAETALHLQIYRRFPAAGAVLHPHSVNATLLSRLQAEAGYTPLLLSDYELLKAFPDRDSHEHSLTVPVFPNIQDIAVLAQQVDDHMHQYPTPWGYLIAGHGFYTWGATVDEALRHVEAFEFLFTCEMRLRGLKA